MVPWWRDEHGRVSKLNSIELDKIILPNCKETRTNSIKLRFIEFSRTSLTGLSVLLRDAKSIFTLTLMNPGGIGFEYVRDLHSDLSSAMARHSLELAGSPLQFRALFNVRPDVISGHPEMKIYNLLMSYINLKCMGLMWAIPE